MSGSDLKQRLAAILAADVAGYSRLMAADERATVSSLDAARAVFGARIEANRGRVIDMAGDSVLAVFETATGAVSAALAVQQELKTLVAEVPEDRRMHFRIGVHLGDVIEKPDGTIYGDGVNIAARLEGLAEPGGIAVSDSIRNAVKGKVAAKFDDQGEQKVKNIDEPVRAFRVYAEGATATNPASWVSAIDTPLLEKPSVAVMPFLNLSDDPKEEHFADGITDDIITELSHYHSLFVIARNSTFIYKRKAVDVRSVSKVLGVRYVLEGSIRGTPNRIRVTAQLIDAITGKHLWAQRYDRELDDILAVQEEVTRSIVTAIAPEIGAAEISKARTRRLGNLSAYEFVLHARADCLAASRTTDSSLRGRAISAARNALSIEPQNPRALSTLAHALFQDVNLRTTPDFQDLRKEGMDAVGRAIRLDLSDNYAYVIRGMFLFFTPRTPDASIRDDDFDEGLSDLRRAHELNPNDPLALRILGLAEASSGNLILAIEHLDQCLRNNPRDRWRCETFAILSEANFLAKNYVSGVKWGLQAVSEASKLIVSYPALAVNYVGVGEIEKAKAALEAARRLAPEYVRVRLDGFSAYRIPEYRDRSRKLVRIAAGLEDPHAADALR